MKKIIRNIFVIALTAAMIFSGNVIGIGNAFGVAAVEVYASERQYEPTIFMRRLPRGNTFSQGHTITRDRFLRTYGDPNHFYFEGRLYSSEDFFDRYNGLGFRWEISTGNPQGVRAHDVTIIPGHVAAPRRVRGTGTTETTAPVSDTLVLNQPDTNNNVPSAQQQASGLQEGDAILFDSVTLLTSDELSDLAAFAPCAVEARSSILLTRQRMTESELAAWIYEYRALGGINAFELEVIRLINIERAEHGLNPLSIVPHYMMAARLRSHSMNDASYFSHNSPVYGGPGAFINLFGRNLSASETLSAGRATPDAVVVGWMNSPGHRRILLSETAGAIGVGRVDNVTTALFMGAWALDELL